jgi:inosine-uridine nucleoside N-ribohydrolase
MLSRAESNSPSRRAPGHVAAKESQPSLAIRAPATRAGPFGKYRLGLTIKPMMKPLHVIVDGGVDDALALAVLVGLNVPISQVIATEGSVDLATTALATRRLMATLGCTVPVRLGSDRGIVADYPAQRDPFHGADAFGGRSAFLAPAAAPYEQANRLDATVLCTGALTCVARAIRDRSSIDEIVWMGGAVAVGGNMTAAAEFNAWMDPTAADLVLASEVGMKMIPLDVTGMFAWSVTEVQALRTSGRIGNLLADAIRYIYERDGIFVPHDAVAAIALTSPELFDWIPRLVHCETKGEFTSGETVVDRRPWGSQGQVMVATNVDVTEVSTRIFRAVASIA